MSSKEAKLFQFLKKVYFFRDLADLVGQGREVMPPQDQRRLPRGIVSGVVQGIDSCALQ